MSADLFAEFATEPTSNQSQQPAAKPTAQPAQNFSFFDNLNTTTVQVPQAQPPSIPRAFQSFQPPLSSVPTNDDTDDWGDFEGESSIVEPAPPVNQDPFAYASRPTSQSIQGFQSFTVPAHDPFAFGSRQPVQQDQGTWQKAPIVKAKKPADSSVLFDAEEDADDDDFGDFEGTETKVDAPVPTQASSALVDVLGDLNVSQSQPTSITKKEEHIPTHIPNASSSRKSPVGGFGKLANSKKPPSPKPAAQVEDDSWDTFDDWEATISTKAPAKTSSKAQPVEAGTGTTKAASPAPMLPLATEDLRPSELPPTNVPPPGVLLSLFPSLFAEAQEKLFKPMAAQTLPMRNKLMAEPATIAYLQGYLVLANVASHIIAGRKLRWKRDQHLSQGMRIGPASSRATSGMKLTGIDKGENLKEEREVSDVVRTWKEQVGRLRHVVSGANQIRARTLGHVPDLQDTMPVKTLKQAEGGIPARQPCMMCGLKREERVTATDMAIDDSFGEWWIDQVNMHRGEHQS